MHEASEDKHGLGSEMGLGQILTLPPPASWLWDLKPSPPLSEYPFNHLKVEGDVA